MSHMSTGEEFAFWIMGSIAVIGALGALLVIALGSLLVHWLQQLL